MATTAGDPERAMDGFLSVARLLEEPRLARVYTFVLREGPVTVDDVVDSLGIARTTAYADTGTLADLGVVTRDASEKTHRFTATPIHLTTDVDGDQYTITPTLIAAVARSEHDRDLDLLVDRHGRGRLAAALTYAVPYAAGELSERVAARELDVQVAFGIAVLQALADVVDEMRPYDPYVEEIRDARTDPPVDS
ncbi:helix-turn-helix domain-containing protein [Halobaculum sp. MBLA0147]|uniref:DUF7437 domain-containing protein n=1 Tax=Halobaculum sp. MBLA0147 TaxID=3079934 RepID=UPI0035239BA7